MYTTGAVSIGSVTCTRSSKCTHSSYIPSVSPNAWSAIPRVSDRSYSRGSCTSRPTTVTPPRTASSAADPQSPAAAYTTAPPRRTSRSTSIPSRTTGDQSPNSSVRVSTGSPCPHAGPRTRDRRREAMDDTDLAGPATLRRRRVAGPARGAGRRRPPGARARSPLRGYLVVHADRHRHGPVAPFPGVLEEFLQPRSADADQPELRRVALGD